MINLILKYITYTKSLNKVMKILNQPNVCTICNISIIIYVQNSTEENFEVVGNFSDDENWIAVSNDTNFQEMVRQQD